MRSREPALQTIATLPQAFSFPDSISFWVGRAGCAPEPQVKRFSQGGKPACPSRSKAMELLVPGPSGRSLAPTLEPWNSRAPQNQRQHGAQWILEIAGPMLSSHGKKTRPGGLSRLVLAHPACTQGWFQNQSRTPDTARCLSIRIIYIDASVCQAVHPPTQKATGPMAGTKEEIQGEGPGREEI